MHELIVNYRHIDTHDQGVSKIMGKANAARWTQISFFFIPVNFGKHNLTLINIWPAWGRENILRHLAYDMDGTLAISGMTKRTNIEFC